MSDAAFIAASINKSLRGATITGARVGEQDEQREALGYPEGELILDLRIQMKGPDGVPVETDIEVGVWSDAEGNGNGWLSLPDNMYHRQPNVTAGE